MKKLKIYFLDWYDWILPGSSEDNIFIWILKKHYDIIIDDKNPDILFYSLYYNKHMEYKNCLKIYVNSEPQPYNNLELFDKKSRHYISISDANHIITSYKSNIKNNFYMPIFLMWLYHHIYVTKKIKSFESLLENRKLTNRSKFCIYLHNNLSPHKRNSIYNELNKYKFVDTKQTIHVPDGSLNKIISLENFKFSFSMQNHYYKDIMSEYNFPGLIDEKIIESLISGSIPLYYGNENIGEYLNEKAFLNYHTFNSDDDFIKKIIEIDQNENLYREIASQPIINDINDLKLTELENHLLNIIKL